MDHCQANKALRNFECWCGRADQVYGQQTCLIFGFP